MNSGDPLIGASNDKIGEILNYETQFLQYFVDLFLSNNDKIVRQMKNVMKEVVFDHFQLTEEKLRDYFQQTNDKLDVITEKLDLSEINSDNTLKKLDYLIATNSDKKLENKLDCFLEKFGILLENGTNNLTPQSNSEEDTMNNLFEEAKCSLQQNEIVSNESDYTDGSSQLGNGVLTTKVWIL